MISTGRIRNAAKRLQREKPEFNPGDKVTYRPYETDVPIIVGEISYPDYAHGRPVYHCSTDGRKAYTNVTTGRCIKESKYFEPWDGKLFD